MSGTRAIGAIALLHAAAGGALADEIYATGGPTRPDGQVIAFTIGGPSNAQAGVRFIPDADYRLDRISLWLMGSHIHIPVRITLETDDPTGGESIPSGDVIEEFEVVLEPPGFPPQLHGANSAGRPLLRAGERYWVVASSEVAPDSAGWNWAFPDLGFASSTDRGVWNPGREGAVGAIVVEGTLDEGCYADCDESGALDFFDFLCFQNAFAAGETYADCDGSGSLDFFDFLCFQNEFAAGCP